MTAKDYHLYLIDVTAAYPSTGEPLYQETHAISFAGALTEDGFLKRMTDGAFDDRLPSLTGAAIISDPADLGTGTYDEWEIAIDSWGGFDAVFYLQYPQEEDAPAISDVVEGFVGLIGADIGEAHIFRHANSGSGEEFETLKTMTESILLNRRCGEALAAGRAVPRMTHHV